MAILDEASDKAPSSVSPMPENGPNANDDHGGYFWGIARFKVGKTRFQLPLYRFVEESKFFASHYGLLDAPSKNGVMNSFVTLDVELEDFEHFLSAFLPRYPHSQVILNKLGWISVLRLSTKWQFNDLRRTAIDRLDCSADLTTMERTTIAKEWQIPPWLFRGYEEFVVEIERNTEQGTGREWTKEEAAVLGWDVIVELQRIVISRQHRTITRNAKLSVNNDLNGSGLLSTEYNKMVEESRVYLTPREIDEERLTKEEEEREEERARIRETERLMRVPDSDLDTITSPRPDSPVLSGGWGFGGVRTPSLAYAPDKMKSKKNKKRNKGDGPRPVPTILEDAPRATTPTLPSEEEIPVDATLVKPTPEDDLASSYEEAISGPSSPKLVPEDHGQPDAYQVPAISIADRVAVLQGAPKPGAARKRFNDLMAEYASAQSNKPRERQGVEVSWFNNM